jgi:uncharacterized membrane protein
MTQFQAAAFSGPLPLPGLIAKYDEIIPNGAERIMAMAERQSAHREQLEKRVVDGNVANQTRGSYFAFILALVAIIGGFFLIFEGKSSEGLVSIITSVSGLVGVFFYSKREQRKERTEKSTALQSRRTQS